MKGTKHNRWTITAAFTAIFMVAVTAAAIADDIANQLDGSVDATYETISLVAEARTVDLYVVPRIGDGKQGCNLTGSTTLVVSVSSSNPSVATVSPDQITFDNCEDAGSDLTTAVTVSPVAPGSADILFSLVSNDTDGEFDLTTARFTVEVGGTITNTPPEVSVTGVNGGSAYEFGTVPAAGCSVADAEDGPQTVQPHVGAIEGALSAHGLGTQQVTCSYTDAGGLTTTASVVYSIVDTTPPTITFESQAPDANDAGWNNTSVTVTWSCADAVEVEDVQISQIISTEGADQSATGTCTDLVGLTASDTVSGINIDTTAPEITWNAGPAAGGAYYFDYLPLAPTCTADDELSGPTGCSTSGYATSVGSHTMTATAYDQAGNMTSEERSYSVLAWNLRGFYRPVDMNGVYNVVKNGSTVPLKFEVFAGTELTGIDAVKSLTYSRIACDGDAITDEIEVLSSGGTVLRYDTTAGQFVYNWQTPKDPGSCYRVTMSTKDGSSLVAFFKLR